MDAPKTSQGPQPCEAISFNKMLTAMAVKPDVQQSAADTVPLEQQLLVPEVTSLKVDAVAL